MTSSWQPTAPFSNLKQRAALLAKIRHFFAERDVLEVETPLLSKATATDPHLHSLWTSCTEVGSVQSKTFYLQTSPEFAMKRLLAAGSGAIYQISKAFREGEAGRQHNPEFTMLEWYRPGFDHRQLMAEVDEFLQLILGTLPASYCSYADLFQHHLAIDPHGANLAELKQCAMNAGVSDIQSDDRDTWLQLLMTHLIEPHLGQGAPTFVYDFPVSQAALARIRKGQPSVAERFEVYVNAIELANGYHELADPKEQRQRFESDLQKREQLGLPEVPIDHHLLAALNYFPDCAGIALGIDRLVMLSTQATSISDVIAFPADRA